MKTSTKNLLRLVFLTLFSILLVNFALNALAQVVTNAPPSGNSGQPSAVLTQLKALEFLLIPAVTVIIQALRKFIPAIPAAAWPWVAPFIGAGLDYLASKAGLWTGNVVVGAMFGGLGTWFHQLDKNSVNVLDRVLPPATP